MLILKPKTWEGFMNIINLKESKDYKELKESKNYKELKNTNIVYIQDHLKFKEMKSLREFADFLLQDWLDSESTLLDQFNKHYKDEVQLEFYEALMAEEGVEGWKADYVLYKLGY